MHSRSRVASHKLAEDEWNVRNPGQDISTAYSLMRGGNRLYELGMGGCAKADSNAVRHFGEAVNRNFNDYLY